MGNNATKFNQNIYRLDMNHTELETIRNLVSGEGFISEVAMESIKLKLDKVKIIKRSEAKSIASYNATKVRIQNAKDKIEKGIKNLRLNNKKLTYYSIANSGRVSLNTVKKYVDEDRLKSLNDLISVS